MSSPHHPQDTIYVPQLQFLKKCAALLRRPANELIPQDNLPQMNGDRIEGNISDEANMAILFLYAALSRLAPDYVWAAGANFDLGPAWPNKRNENDPLGRIPLLVSVPLVASKSGTRETFEKSLALQIEGFLGEVEVRVIRPLEKIEAVQI